VGFPSGTFPKLQTFPIFPPSKWPYSPKQVNLSPNITQHNTWQVVAYNPGEFYTEHYDNKAGSIVTRSATIICYLNDCPSGGATFFPKSTGVAWVGLARTTYIYYYIHGVYTLILARKLLNIYRHIRCIYIRILPTLSVSSSFVCMRPTEAGQFPLSIRCICVYVNVQNFLHWQYWCSPHEVTTLCEVLHCQAYTIGTVTQVCWTLDMRRGK